MINIRILIVFSLSLWGCGESGHDHGSHSHGGHGAQGGHAAQGGEGGHAAQGGAGGHAAHGGEGGHAAQGGEGAQGGQGGTEDGADTYVAGLEKSSAEGMFTVRLAESDPIPRDTGIYTWIIEVVDAQGAPVTGATIQAEPTMPAHGHGTMPQYTDGVESSELPGTYSLSSMDLFMPGIWRVAIRITHGEEHHDMVMYHFDLEG